MAWWKVDLVGFKSVRVEAETEAEAEHVAHELWDHEGADHVSIDNVRQWKELK